MTSVAFSRPFFGKEEEEAAAQVVRSGWVVGGPRLQEFEARFATLSGVPYAVGVSSWTTGAFLVLTALGIGPGDEVIVPSLTFIASVNVIVHAGAKPVFVDIDPRTFNLVPEKLEQLITPRTKAILPVDQIGLPCEIDQIMAIAARHDLIVIQDAACSFASRFRGQPVGAVAPITVYSLHARKVVTTAEGGMIVTHDEQFARRLKRLRHQGMSLSDFERHGASPTTFETYPEVGYNYRITDIQAAVGLCQLDRLEWLLATRRRIAGLYVAALREHPFIEPPFVPDHVEPNWQSFQIRLKPGAPITRDRFMEELHAMGIATRRGVMASHLEEPYRAYGATLPATEEAAVNCLQLPIHSGMTEDDAGRVIASLVQILKA